MWLFFFENKKGPKRARSQRDNTQEGSASICQHIESGRFLFLCHHHWQEPGFSNFEM
jgi:hypothetical protein